MRIAGIATGNERVNGAQIPRDSPGFRALHQECPLARPCDSHGQERKTVNGYIYKNEIEWNII